MPSHSEKSTLATAEIQIQLIRLRTEFQRIGRTVSTLLLSVRLPENARDILERERPANR